MIKIIQANTKMEDVSAQVLKKQKAKPKVLKQSKPSLSGTSGSSVIDVTVKKPAAKLRSAFAKIHGETHVRIDMWEDLIAMNSEPDTTSRGERTGSIRVTLIFKNNIPQFKMVAKDEKDAALIGRKVRDAFRKYGNFDLNKSIGDDLDMEMEEHENADLHDDLEEPKEQRPKKKQKKAVEDIEDMLSDENDELNIDNEVERVAAA